MKKLVMLYVIIFLGYLALSMSVILFTTMILSPNESLIDPSESLKKKSYLLGTLISMYPLGQLIGKSLIGRLSDHLGRKKVLVFSLFSSFLLYGLVGLSIEWLSFPLLIVALFLLGLSEGNIVIAQAVISEQSKDRDERIKCFGVVATMISLSRIIGPLLVISFPVNIKALPFDFALPFYSIALCFLTLFFITIFLFDYPDPVHKIYRTQFSIFSQQENKNFHKIFLGNFLFYLSSAGLFRLYPIYLTTEFGMNTVELSQAVALNGVGYILASYCLIPRLKKFNSLFLILLFSGISTILMFSLTLTFAISLTLVLMVIASIIMGAAFTYTIDITAHLASKENLGEMMGTNSSLNTLSTIVIGFVGSYLLTISSKGPMLGSAFFALLASLVFLKVIKNLNLKKEDTLS